MNIHEIFSKWANTFLVIYQRKMGKTDNVLKFTEFSGEKIVVYKILYLIFINPRIQRKYIMHNDSEIYRIFIQDIMQIGESLMSNKHKIIMIFPEMATNTSSKNEEDPK